MRTSLYFYDRCHICGKVCTQHSTLRVHLKFHEEASFDCSVCGKKLKTEKSLRWNNFRTLKPPDSNKTCPFLDSKP